MYAAARVFLIASLTCPGISLPIASPGAIGRRYRRMDEVGTPYCITVDFETLEDGTVTLRDRDTTEQRRVSMQELLDFLEEKIDG